MNKIGSVGNSSLEALRRAAVERRHLNCDRPEVYHCARVASNYV